MLETRTLTDLKDVIDAAQSVYAELGKGVWWRGQSCDDTTWKLLPHVLRPGWDTDREKHVTGLFRIGAGSRHTPVPDWADYSGWLFLMQHYGLPTRLLDWTEAALVATFFSVEEMKYVQNDGILWALNPYLYNERQTGQRGIFWADRRFIKRLFRYPFSNETETPGKNYAVLARETDIRMLAQLSRFTIHGSTTALEDEDAAEQYLRRFRIPASAKDGLWEQLKAMGIRRSLLFPDLENLADELAHTLFEKPAAETSDRGSRPASEAEEPSHKAGT